MNIKQTDTLQIVLAAAKTANDMDVVIKYRDDGVTTLTHERMLTNSNGLTDVNILTSPIAGHTYLVDNISIYNRDSVLHNVTVKYDVSAAEKILYKGDVAAGGKLEYSNASGWSYIAPSPQGYTINVQALTSSPADTTPFYFGTKPAAITTTAGQNKIYIRKAGTLKIAEIYTYSGTAGTAEAVSMYVRVNNTTDYLISTLSVSVNERIFTNLSLSIPLAVGDYFEIKGIPPIWATNPLTFIAGGYVYIE
jgi:hypothetical protein